MRVLALACRPLDERKAGEDLAENLIFLGLAAMSDPPRPQSHRAVAEAKKAGIRTVMITGDHKATAVAVAADIGIFVSGDLAVTGAELEQMDEQALEKMFRVIEKKKVKCLVGYSSALGELSNYIQKTGKDCSRCKVKAIIPISETMPEPVRRTLEKQFDCPVRAWYSNEENGIMGLQNEDDEGYRIDTETYYYEILKMDSDEPAEPGELGRIVITDLFNYAFPILRYDNGDTAVATRKEKNGRYRLYLDELYGRRSDLIYDCEGKAVTPYIITNNLWDIEGVKQYRFIQEDVKDYTIWLNGDPQKMNQEEILGRIRPYLGEEARIRVELVDEIPVLASGKRKYIENRCEKYKNQTGFCG